MADGYGAIPALGGADPLAYGRLTGDYYGGIGPRSVGQQESVSFNQAQNTSQAQNQSQSQSYIPDYSQTPILEEIAQYARSMAPQVYDWGMQQFTKNQGNIDNLMRQGQEWASPAHIAAMMGQAEAGVQQAGEQARQSSLQDLQSYGIDPSAGRYAALDQANRVQTAASAAGAGNQQRQADIAQGLTMQNQAIASSNQNVQTGYGAANAMNNLLGTGMQLKYSPLGTTASSSGSSYGQGTSSGTSESQSYNLGAMPTGGGGGGGGGNPPVWYGGNISPGGSASLHMGGVASGGYIGRDDVEAPGHQYGGAVRRGKRGARKAGGRGRMPKPQRAKGGRPNAPQDQPQDQAPTAGAPLAPPAAPPPPGYGDELPTVASPQEGAPQAPLTALPQPGVPPPPPDEGYAGGGVVGTTAAGFVPSNPVAGPAGYTSAAPVRGFDDGGLVAHGGGQAAACVQAINQGKYSDPMQCPGAVSQTSSGFARGGQVGYGETTGGFVSHALSPSNGKQVDDVPARLNEGEYVIPRDVVHWRGKEFFHKLIMQSRKAREQHGAPSDERGYNFGGPVQQSDGSGFNLGGAI